jgi:hypothetical protein
MSEQILFCQPPIIEVRQMEPRGGPAEGFCENCQGRGYIGETWVIYDPPPIGARPSVFERRAAVKCMRCGGTGLNIPR